MCSESWLAIIYTTCIELSRTYCVPIKASVVTSVLFCLVLKSITSIVTNPFCGLVEEAARPYIYRLDNEAKGSTRNRNLRSHTIEPKRKVRGFYMASRVSMEHRSRWPSCLTDLEYSNCCYAADVFHLQAFACLTLARFVEQSEERQQTGL